MSNIIEFTIKGRDAISGAFKSATTAINDTAKVVKSFATKIAAAAGAVIGFVTIVANGVDAAKKFSDRIGVAVEELSKMQFVASQAGISTEQFNMATQRMTRRVAEAAQGVGEATGALNELGINARDFTQLGLEDKMAVLAGAMENVEAPADRLRLAFKLFDSEGTAMLQMLKNGSDAMREAAADAEFLGLAISDQAAANAEAFTDAMGRATGSIKGVSRGIADELMPLLTGLSNRFADTLAASRTSIVSFVSAAVENIVTFGYVVGQVWDAITKAFSSKEGFSNFLDNLGNWITAGLEALWSFGKMLPVILWESVKAATTIFVDFFKWLGGAIIDFAKGNQVQDFSDTMAASIGDAFSNAGTAISEGLQDPLDEFLANTETAAVAAAETFGINMESARDKAKDAINEISEFGTVAAETVSSTMAAVDAAQQAWNARQQTFMRSLETAYDTFADSVFGAMESGINALSDGLADLILDGGNLADVLSNVANIVLRELISALIRMGIQRVLLSSVNIGANVTESSAGMAKAAALTYANAFSSAAATPVVGPAIAPGIASASSAAMIAGATAAGSVGAGTGAAVGAAHGGLTNVPNEATYLLNAGERVLSPNQNEDLTNFLAGSAGGGGGITIELMEVHILEGVTSGNDLTSMDPNDLREKYAIPLIQAFDSLADQGITFQFVRRTQ